MQYVVVEEVDGCAFANGVVLHGPFNDAEVAKEFAKEHFASWVVAPIVEPEVVDETAKDEFAGFHQFIVDGETYGSFEVFYNAPPLNGGGDRFGYEVLARNLGWFWWTRNKNEEPESAPEGPFTSAQEAYLTAIAE